MCLLMTEPILLGMSLPQIFLYFLWYSFLGWAMETAFCSIQEKRFVARGFLKGPICPIYGVGVLMMIVCLTPLISIPPLFYAAALVSMSAWEYLVGWLLEVTTHMKYWDYSNVPLNLHGRICLPVSLWWGLAAYLVIRLIHPASVSLMARVPTFMQQCLAAVLLVDIVTTLRKLVLTTRTIAWAEQLRQQMEDINGRLRQQLGEAGESLRKKADEALLQAELLKLEARHSELLRQAERHSERFRRRYSRLSSSPYARTLAELRARGAGKLSALREKKEKKKAKDPDE